MKIFYWCPFISKVATVKAVINSADSLVKYSKDKLKPFILNAAGEWDSEIKIISEKKIGIINLPNKLNYNTLPRFGFIRSRITYILIFLNSFFPLYKILKKEKPEYLIIHLVSSLPLILLFLFKFETKFILRISGLPKLNIFRKFLWNLITKKIYLVTSPTRGTIENLEENQMFYGKLKFLPDPIIDLKSFGILKKEKTDIHKEFSKDKSILSIGRLTKQKNFSFLIKCFKKILNKHENLNLFIIGEGELKKDLEELINKENLNEKVFLLGFKDNVYKYLNNCKCFILSSFWEDPGFVLIEAGIANATIISSNCPNGPVEILESGKNGYLFKSNNEKDFYIKFDDFINSDMETIMKKKLNLKKNIKIYTKFYHYKKIFNLFK